MIPMNIKRVHVVRAIREIALNRIPPGRGARKFSLAFNRRKYPPKYVLGLANKYANGKELSPSDFSGGRETNQFLRNMGFFVDEISLLGQKDVSIPTGEGLRSKIKGKWVATVVLQSNRTFGQSDNKDREIALRDVLNETIRRTSGNGILLFPGGYFNSGRKKANTILDPLGSQLRAKLRKTGRNIIICLGVDGRLGAGYQKDQLAMAVSMDGIIAIGRKFHPTKDEKTEIDVAPNYQSLEEAKTRLFSINGRRHFMAVCYDVFGLKGLPNPGVTVILNTIHQFTPRCRCVGNHCKCGAASGDVDFARKGLAGASKAWKCPVFASVVFYKRDIPEKWPSGVYWNQGNKSIQKWKYKNNPMKAKDTFELPIKEGAALVKVYRV
jgi:hypothetical protein